MRRFLLSTTTLLLIMAVLHSPAVRTQEPVNVLPNPADYPAAGPNCKRRVKLSPWIGTPEVEWPKTFQCVLSIQTCDGVKTYKSGVRASGTGMCADYWAAHDALKDLEVCCDPGSRPDPKGEEQKKNCEPPRPREDDPPWLDKNAPCQNRQQGTHSWGQNRRNPGDVSHTINMCGQVIRFVQPYGSEGERMPPGVRSFDVCCDSWQDAVSTSSPCDPLRDTDCDGTLNESDTLPLLAPRTRGSSDDFVINSPVGNLFFWREIYKGMPRQSDCKDCKWELVGVQYTCENKVERISSRSESLNAEYKYQATWKCPANGQTKVTTDSATMEGQDHRRGSRCCRCPTPPNRSWP